VGKKIKVVLGGGKSRCEKQGEWGTSFSTREGGEVKNWEASGGGKVQSNEKTGRMKGAKKRKPCLN